MDVPWWALSPSPFTIAFYIILALYAMRKLLKVNEDKRFKHLVVFTDAIFIVGFIVLTTDTLWILASGLRFGWLYPKSVSQLVFAAGRNLAALTLCYLLIAAYFKDGIINLVNARWFYLLNALFLIAWFLLAPSPAWTDWTFAIRHNYPPTTVLTSFLVSHGIGKSLVACIFISALHMKDAKTHVPLTLTRL